MIVKIGKHSVFYHGSAAAGTDPALIFLHGSGGDHRVWADAVSHFTKEGRTVFALDMPRHGQSGGPAFSSIEESAAILAAFIDAHEIGSAHLIGHSQGFLSALGYARTHPARVRSICAVASAAKIPVNPALIETAKTDASKAAQLMTKWGFGPGASEAMKIRSCAQMATAELAADLLACDAYSGGAGAALVIKNAGIPSHCILGALDKMTPHENGMALAKALGAAVTTLDGIGHMIPIEAAPQMIAAISDHILAAS